MPPTVKIAFAIGAGIVLVAAAISLRAPDSPAEPFAITATVIEPEAIPAASQGIGFLLFGAGLAAFALAFGLRREIYLLTLICIGYGAAVEWVRVRRRRGRPIGGLLHLVDTIATMPAVMARLAVVQFFTWFGLFTLWVYAVPAIAAREAGGIAGYNDSADRVGLFFAFFDAAAIIAALALPPLIHRAGLVRSHQFSLVMGAVGLAGLLLTPSLAWSWLPAIAVGIGWASILSAPYTIVANSVPRARVGTYLGIHNIFLVVPQLAAAASLGVVARAAQAQSAVIMVWVAVGSLLLAALSCLLLPRRES